MEILKQLRFIVILTGVVAILAIFRLTETNNFKPGADKLAEPSVTGANIIAADRIESLYGEKLLVNLSAGENFPANISIKTIDIPASAVLDKNNLRIIRKNKGPVLLYSSEQGLSARIWMILSQTGLKNIYVLTTADEEAFKKEFHPVIQVEL